MVTDDPSAGALMKSWTDKQQADFANLAMKDVCLA
jgi:hypothetical protein